MLRSHRILACYLLLLMAIPAKNYIGMIWVVGGIWSPMDEMAHYDYIDQLGSGRLPYPTDPISDHTFQLSMTYFDFLKPSLFQGTRETMAAGGNSYEAHQPPFYYLLLTPVDLLLKAAGVHPDAHIRLLRSFNLLFYAGTAALIILIFRDLGALTGIEPLFGYFAAHLAFATGFLYRYHLSPDQLAPLLGAASVWLMVRLWRTGRARYVVWSALAVALAFLTKYPSALLLPVWAVSTLFFYERRGWPPLRQLAIHVSPFLLPAAFLAGNVRMYGWADIVKSSKIAGYFNSLIGVMSPPDGLVRLMDQSTGLQPYLVVTLGLAALLAAVLWGNYALAFYRVLIAGNRSMIPLFAACQVSVIMFGTAFLLNPYILGVGWFDFRHYGGVHVFWYTAMLATPMLFESRRIKIAGACAGTVLATAITWIWF